MNDERIVYGYNSSDRIVSIQGFGIREFPWLLSVLIFDSEVHSFEVLGLTKIAGYEGEESHATYSYNNDGNLAVAALDINSDGTMNRQLKYAYNRNGRVSIVEHDGGFSDTGEVDGIVDAIYNYSYDHRGDIARITWGEPGGDSLQVDFTGACNSLIAHQP